MDRTRATMDVEVKCRDFSRVERLKRMLMRPRTEEDRQGTKMISS